MDINGGARASPKREVPIPAVSRGDEIFNAIGLALNASLTLWGIGWLALHAVAVAPPLYALVLAVLTGLFLADFASGLLHWAFDTWFTENTPVLRRVVMIVREHHIYPQHIFRYGFRDEAGTISWPSLAYVVPAVALVTLRPGGGTVLGYCALLVAVIVATLTLFMFEFHKLGHRKSPVWVVRALQRARLLMGPQHHGRHHRGNHDVKYCLINGWADFVMDSTGFWRGAEWAIRGLTHAGPRINDLVWMKRFRPLREHHAKNG